MGINAAAYDVVDP